MKHFREILAIATPAIVSNITTPILGIVDVAISGHLGDAVYIGAIALGSTLVNITYWLFNFLRMGTSGLTAQAYGSANKTAMSITLWRSLAVAVTLGMLILLAGFVFGGKILAFMDHSDQTLPLATRYFRICIAGAPAVMMGYSLQGWLIGMQNSRIPMWSALITNITNIAISFTLVYGLNCGVEGIAAGTCSAQWVGLCATALMMRRFDLKQLPSLRNILDWEPLKRFFRINTDIFFRTACLVAVTLWFTHAGAIQGVDILAANALLLQLFMVFSFFIDGFAYAGEALAGKYQGRGSLSAVKSLTKSILVVGLAFAVLFSVLYLTAGEWFLGMLADDKKVVALASVYLNWAVLIPFCGFGAFVMDGIFVGLTKTRAMLLAMASAMASFFAVYFIAKPTMGNDALWLAFLIYLAVRGLVEGACFVRFMRTGSE